MWGQLYESNDAIIFYSLRLNLGVFFELYTFFKMVIYCVDFNNKMSIIY